MELAVKSEGLCLGEIDLLYRRVLGPRGDLSGEMEHLLFFCVCDGSLDSSRRPRTQTSVCVVHCLQTFLFSVTRLNCFSVSICNHF